jgi:hypothetical protein
LLKGAQPASRLISVTTPELYLWITKPEQTVIHDTGGSFRSQLPDIGSISNKGDGKVSIFTACTGYIEGNIPGPIDYLPFHGIFDLQFSGQVRHGV